MIRRPLGQSGIEASAVGLGTWAIGGWMWGGASEEDSIRAIHAAMDAGIDLIDTAPIYGLGLSETVVGRAIKDRRDDVVLATKCGMVAQPGKGEFMFRSNAQGPDDDGHIEIRKWLNPHSIREEVELSLRRLGTDRIDLYQTHWQDETTPIEDTMGALLDLKREGKIRAIGVSNATVAQMEHYRAVGPLDADQEKYNMLDRDLDAEQLPYCADNTIAVLAYSPMAKGLLTGKVSPDREFAPGDTRRGRERFSVENRQRVMDMLGRFRQVAERHEASLAQLAVAWSIHQRGLTHALVGAREPKQARENAAAGSIRLSADDLGAIEAVLSEYAEVLV